MRESPALRILELLLLEGAKVRAYDPVGMTLAAEVPRSGLTYCEDELDAARGAEVLVVATEWNQFRGLDPDRLKAVMKEPVIVDLRNVYEPEAMRAKGFRYTCIGRP